LFRTSSVNTLVLPGEGNRALKARAITVLGTQGCACLLIPPMGGDLEEPAVCLGSSSAAKDPILLAFLSGYVKGWVPESLFQKQDA